MKNKIVITVALLLAGVTATAQQKGHYLSIGGGIGTSSLNYDLNGEGSRRGGLGFSGEIGYSYFFDKNWGIGTGVGISRYETKSVLNTKYSFERVIDNEGDIYRRDVILNDWREIQTSMFLEIPLTLDFQTKFGKEKRHGIYANAGIKAQLPITKSKYDVDAKYDYNKDVHGYYYDWNVLLEDKIHEGFEKTTQKFDGETELNFGIAATGSLGFLFGLSKRCDLYVGATFDYGLMDVRPDSKGDLVSRDRDNNEDVFTNVLESRTIDRVNPISFRGEAGVRIRLGKLQSRSERDGVSQPVIPTAQERMQQENAKKLEEAANKLEEATRNLGEATRNLEEAARRGEEQAKLAKEVEKAEKEKKKAAVAVIELEPVDGYNIAVVQLTDVQKEILDRKIAILREAEGVEIILVGHTCDIDSESKNREIGMERAMYVKEYLVENGIDSSRISYKTKGKSTSIVPNTSEANRKKNRRVEFEIR